MDNTTFQDVLKLEERNWNNWIASAEKVRDENLAALARLSASKGTYQSGGRLKEDLKIIFAAIDDVVTRAVTLRTTLAAQNPELADLRSLTSLKLNMAELVEKGITQMDDRFSKTFQGSVPGTREAILGLARKEATSLLDRVTNDLENIPLELKLNPKKQEGNTITIHVSGNSGIVNLGSVMGDLNNSVQTLNQSGQRDIADAIEKFGAAIRESTELKDEDRRAYLEHLTTIGEEVAKPPEKRRIATFLTAVNSVATIGSIAVKLAPLYESLHALLVAHQIIAP